MTEIVVGPAVEQVSNYLIPRIGRQLGYLFNYQSNVDELKKQVKKLDEARERLQQWVDEANRQGREIFSDVHNWLNAAQQMIPETEEFIRNEMEANRGCFNLKLRYQRSKQAKNRVGDLSEKIQEAERIGDKVSHPPPPPPVIRSSSLIGYEALESRASTLNQIMEALRSDDTRMIGVWGMGGVGKTTLVKQVAKQADEGSFFDKVVIAYVSQVPNLANIHGEIAVTLGLKFGGGDDEASKANRLSESLKKHKKVLVILDDIWEKIDLGKIGIPYGDDHRGCQILLTSRKQDLLSKEMGSQKNFHVGHLCEEEAWHLFKKTAGDSVEKPELNSTATEVAKKCAGLPIAIVAVAKALKDEPLDGWEDALDQLEKSIKTDIDEEMKVFSSLELSYKHLKSNQAQSMFLLCGFFDYGDTRIEDLLRYGFGLGLFDERISTVEKARKSLHAVIRKLKSASLLLESGDGDTDEYVRMHDVVRQVARAIASKDSHRFVVNNDVELQRLWDGCGNCTRISLKCKDVQKLPEGLVCPNLEFFLLNSVRDTYRSWMVPDSRASEIPDTWFDETKELKVLGLSNVHLTPLPLSLRLLSNLRTLCLEKCVIGDIAIIGELKKLQIVSFFGSMIKQLPKEMMQLSDLRVLDLEDCIGLSVIPRNVISSLSRLEELRMGGSFRKWEGGGVKEGESNASLSELKHLFYLRYLDVDILDPESLPQDLVLDNLDKFRISVGTNLRFRAKSSRRSLQLHKVTRLQQVNCFSKLLKRTEHLRLCDWRLQSAKHDLCELDKEDLGFRVEELELLQLHDLEAVWHCPIRMGSFSNLRSLLVWKCEKLKYVIVLPTEQGNERLVFPQLRELRLSNLPKVVSFNSIGTTTTAQECLPFFNHQVAFPNLKKLNLRGLYNVTTLWHKQFLTNSLENLHLHSLNDLEAVWHGPIRMGSFDNLRTLEVEECSSLKHVIVQPLAQGTERLVFPQLQELKLHALPEVVSFNSSIGTTTATQEPVTFFNHQVAFPNLKKLNLLGLYNVRTMWHEQFLTNSLENLHLHSLNDLEAVWHGPIRMGSFDNLRTLEVEECSSLKHVIVQPLAQGTERLVFPQLQELKLHALPEVVSFNSSIGTTTATQEPVTFFNHQVAFPNLKKLNLLGLYNVRTLWHEQFLTNSLENLHLHSLNDLEAVWHGPIRMGSFDNLRTLEVEECSSLKHVIVQPLAQGTERLVFPQLQELKLHALPEVVSFNSSIGTTTATQEPVTFFNHQVAFPNLKKLNLLGLYNVRTLWHEQFLTNSLENLHLRRINKLEEVWHGPIRTGSFDNLRTLEVEECSSLKHVIVQLLAQGTERLVFPQLQELKLHALPEVVSFNSSIGTTTATQDPVTFFNHLVTFPNLKRLNLWGLYNVRTLWHEQFLTNSLKNLHLRHINKLEEVWHGPIRTGSFDNLRTLEVEECSILKHVIVQPLIQGTERLVFPQLQELKLHALPEVVSFNSAIGTTTATQEPATFFNYQVAFPNLKKLNLWGLYNVRTLWHEQFLTNSLENLHLRRINKLEEVWHGPIRTGSFDNLRTLEVVDCSSLKHVIVQLLAQGTERLVFPQLQELKLLALPEVVSFNSSIGTTTATQEPVTFFNHQVAFPNLKNLDLFGLDNVRTLWHNQLLTNYFCKLESLKIVRCGKLLNVFPSNILKGLQSLQTIEISNCDSLEEVFDVNGMNAAEIHDVAVTALRELSLSSLNTLKSIWKKDPHGLVTFQNLQMLNLDNCPHLKWVFPVSVAKDLLQLKFLRIESCGVTEIIANENIDEQELSKMKDIIVAAEVEEEEKEINEMNDLILCFPNLCCLELQGLQELESMWKGTITCDSLQEIVVWDCPKLKRLPISVSVRIESGERRASTPPLKKIRGMQEWWNMVEWDTHPDAKSVFQPLFLLEREPVTSWRGTQI